jgi:hypothetical protein
MALFERENRGSLQLPFEPVPCRYIVYENVKQLDDSDEQEFEDFRVEIRIHASRM